MLLDRLKTYALALFAFLAALAGTAIYWRQKGKQAQKDADKADAANEVIHAHEVRDAVETEVQALPEAPPQKVADADPATAAGRLQGWTRD